MLIVSGTTLVAVSLRDHGRSRRARYLQNNQIRTLDAGAFAGLASLTTLALAGNYISALDAATFTPVAALTTLCALPVRVLC